MSDTNRRIEAVLFSIEHERDYETRAVHCALIHTLVKQSVAESYANGYADGRGVAQVHAIKFGPER